MGQVVVSNTDPSQSLAEGTGLKVGEVGREANITLTTKDFDGNQYYDENDRIGVTVKTPSSKGLTYRLNPTKMVNIASVIPLIVLENMKC